MSEHGGFEPPSGPPAGWYPDPYGGSNDRYWDGRAWDLSSPTAGVHPSAEMPDDHPDIGDWLDVSFRSAYRRWRSVAVVALFTAPTSTALGYLAIDRALDGLVIEGDELSGWTTGRLPGVITLTILAAVIGTIGSIAVSLLMLREIDGADGPAHSLGDEISAAFGAFLDTAKVLPRALGWLLLLVAGIVVAGLMFALATALTLGLGLMLLFVIAPALVWLAVKWWFLIVAIIDRPGNPFTRSSQVSSGRWWRTFGRLLLIGIIVWLISAAVQTGAALLVGGDLTGLGGGTEITIDDDGGIERFAFDEELDFGTRVTIAASIASLLITILASSVLASATAALYRSRHPRR